MSATLRASYTFTPQLTLQAYAQAFLASGHFDDMRFITQTDAAAMLGDEIRLSDLDRHGDLQRPAIRYAPPRGDFQDAALNINVVFRWEYRLGSTIYFVYSHSQIPTVPTVGIHASGDARSARLRPRRHLRRLPAEVLVLVGELTGATPRTASAESDRPGGRDS